jgi:maltose alpha-D-glucosyltransferase/alpha-amylase
MDSWHKHAVFYGIEVKTFFDGNGDGIGDFVGITKKLDYLEKLGVTCIWLLPFYPTSSRDNGYDITDYMAIDPDYGTLDEFKQMVKEAHKRNIKVIIDLVVHHTSNLHPWFLEAKKSKKSPYHNYYVWTEKIPKENTPDAVSAFPRIEAGVWRFDGTAKAFYFHSFYYFEPDLNIANKKVEEEIFSIVEYWMKTGIDGFRIDAATMLFERKGLDGTEVKNAAVFLESLQAYIKKVQPEAILLAEADVSAEKIGFFFGEGNRMNLLYNFLLNRYIILGLAHEEATPIIDEFKKLPVPPESAQWVNLLRNLDELNIQQLTPEEQKDVYAAFGPDKNMQIYGRGIRRRFAPMLNGDLRRINMAYNLIFSLPGAVMMVYGEEIGMGDFLDLPERESVRVPMQWDISVNAGFSKVDPKGMIRMVLNEGPYRYKKLNVQIAEQNEASLLNHIKHLIKIQHTHPEITHGTYSILEPAQKSVFGMFYHLEKDKTIVLTNLSKEPCSVSLKDLADSHFEEFFADSKYNKKVDPNTISINGYGYRWFRITNKNS